ncbi:energy transducer TonB [Endozoicomonas sp. G2_1]|uniref:energy transducer TonB n=1 Tax=Endozoicomonas sp. G2_1 TaxID=2821091 RepID=UPI001ADB3DD9|nr:energy transducer TonB [Endozoicomonas sp. G2_1]MBO9492343.1 energy transducer TonB [Endozoicomonas sp. G2_1]
MKLLSVLIISLLVIAGCKSTPERYLTKPPITVEQSDLKDYWVHVSKEFSFKTGKLKQPKEPGFVKIMYLIDSNGEIFEPKIVESVPDGAWDKFALRALSNLHYAPAKANSSNRPVYVTTTLEFGL